MAKLNLAKYNKFFVALAGAIATYLVQQYADNEVVQSLVPFLTAIGVYQVRNAK